MPQSIINYLKDNKYYDIEHISKDICKQVYTAWKDNKLYAIKYSNSEYIQKLRNAGVLSGNEIKFNMLNSNNDINLIYVNNIVNNFDDNGGVLIIYNYIENTISLGELTKICDIFTFDKNILNSKNMSYFLDMCSKIFNTINQLHSNGIIHMDITIDNILVVPNFNNPLENQYYIIDFGLNCLLKNECRFINSHLPPIFNTPEAIDKFPEWISPKLDIFSMGIVLLECLCNIRFDIIRTLNKHKYNEIFQLYPFIKLMIDNHLDNIIDSISELLPIISKQQSLVEFTDIFTSPIPC